MMYLSPSLFVLIGMIVVSVLLCGIPFGMVFAKSFCATDIRQVGSGNIGMTNVARNCGKTIAAATFVCDAGKGFLCLMIARAALRACADIEAFDGAALRDDSLLATYMAWLYLACVFGHIFSIYLKGKGGKGISVGFGAGLAINPYMALLALGCFFIFTFATKRVSVGSLAACFALPISAYFLGLSQAELAPIVLVALVVIWAHRANIKRLIQGVEPAFSAHKTPPKAVDPKN